MARGAFDIYYFLLFVPIVLIPFSPTSVLSLQPLFGLLYGAKQAAWHSNICLLFLGLIKFLSIYFPWVPNHCSSFLMSPVYLVNGKSKATHVFLFEPLTSGLYRQHGKEEKGLGSLHYSHCPTLCSALMQSQCNLHRTSITHWDQLTSRLDVCKQVWSLRDWDKYYWHYRRKQQKQPFLVT